MIFTISLPRCETSRKNTQLGSFGQQEENRTAFPLNATVIRSAGGLGGSLEKAPSAPEIFLFVGLSTNFHG
jgi:hypothetical protein